MTSQKLVFPSPFPSNVALTSLTRSDTGANVAGTITGLGSTWVVQVIEPIVNLPYNYELLIAYPNGSTEIPPPGTIIGQPAYSIANQYATPEQYFAAYDQRTGKQLSGDQNTSQGTPSNIQFLLDMQAAEFDASINGLYNLPLVAPISLVVTKYVCCTTAIRLFARRSDRPKQLDSDEKWAGDWIKQVMATTIIIPGQQLSANAYPVLADSDFYCGGSRFDRVFRTPPPRASQSANPGYLNGPNNGGTRSP